MSAQLRDLVTVALLLENTLNKVMSLVHIFKDSWAVIAALFGLINRPKIDFTFRIL